MIYDSTPPRSLWPNDGVDRPHRVTSGTYWWMDDLLADFAGLTEGEVRLAVRHMRSLPQGQQHVEFGPNYLPDLEKRLAALEESRRAMGAEFASQGHKIANLEDKYTWLRDNLDALREGLADE